MTEDRSSYSRRQRTTAIIAICALLVTIGGGLGLFLLLT
jgi:hypothetical protein